MRKELCGEVGGYEKKEMKKAHGQKKKKGPKKRRKTQTAKSLTMKKPASNHPTARQTGKWK